MIYVVGSGPAGVSCAMALLDRGATVTMLDAGLRLERDYAEQTRRLTTISPSSWTVDDLRFLKHPVSAGTNGIPLKTAYGSDFAYRNPSGTHFHSDGADTRPSFALGGFSNVWGAAVMPYSAADLRGWPISAADLAPHYRAVTRFMPIARDGGGGEDALESEFPIAAESPQAIDSSRQTRAWLQEVQAHRAALEREGIRVGASRLAVAATRANGKCVYCRLCMYGCPYELIYNAAHTVEELRGRDGFHYLDGISVERVREHGTAVTIEARRGPDRISFEATRAFLACGALSTAAVLLRSTGAHDRPVRLLDSQYYLLPLVRYARSHGASEEAAHTLAQAFVEINDAQISARTVHLQIYSYNELFADAVRQMLGPAELLLRAPARALLERMLLVQGYLPSELSAHIEIRLHSGGGNDKVELRAVENTATSPALRAVVRKLARNTRNLRARPLGMLMRTGKAGRGYHSGGTFPMRRSPAALETDTLGRLHGWERVHAVDSSILPDIPATTITFSVMANAHRIGAEAPL